MTQLDTILEAVKKTRNPIKVILFGSYASRKVKEGSDVDLAVIQKEKTKLGQKADVYQYLWEKNYDWSVEPDIHIFSEEDFQDRVSVNDLFAREILKGKVLYEK